MPRGVRVRPTDRDDGSTRRMSSRCSAAGISWIGRPPRPSDFFAQPMLEQHLGQQLRQGRGRGPQPCDFVAGGGAGGIAPFLARRQEFLRPPIIQILLMPSWRHSSAMLSSPRTPVLTMPTFSSAVYCRRGARRISRTTFSASSDCRSTVDPIAPPALTMSSNPLYLEFIVSG
jgi:hypothetical protein